MRTLVFVLGAALLTVLTWGPAMGRALAAETAQAGFNEPGQPQCANPADLEPFEQDGRFGFRNTTGETVIAARYVVAQCFLSTGIAAVADEKGWAYIDREGREILRPFLFDNGPDYFAEGLARFVENGKMGFFDTSGRVVIKAQFEWVGPFSNGRAKFCTGCQKQVKGEHWTMSGGTWGQIDRQGNLINP